jgi:DNA-binding NtrC family response regulator
VRELKNALHRAYIMAKDEVDLDAGNGPRPIQAAAAKPSAGDDANVGLTLEEIERRTILATLEHAGGDKRKAAKVLGISLKTLYNRLNVYNAAARPEPVSDGGS